MTPYKNDLFFGLEVLGARITPKEVEDYEQAIETYQSEISDWESNQELNILRGIEKPKAPSPLGSDVSFSTMYLNFGRLYIKSWSMDTDPITQESIVIAYIIDAHTAEAEYLNIKISQDEWVKLLTDLGATVKKL